MEEYTIEEIMEEFGDCDWMRAWLNEWTVGAILWLMKTVWKYKYEKDEKF